LHVGHNTLTKDSAAIDQWRKRVPLLWENAKRKCFYILKPVSLEFLRLKLWNKLYISSVKASNHLNEKMDWFLKKISLLLEAAGGPYVHGAIASNRYVVHIDPSVGVSCLSVQM